VVMKSRGKTQEKIQLDKVNKVALSGNLGKAYASMLLSIMNYGYNIANRRPFPSSEFAFKETGKETNIANEEQYMRNEESHPSRLALVSVQKKIEEITSNSTKKLFLLNDIKNKLESIEINSIGFDEMMQEIKKTSVSLGKDSSNTDAKTKKDNVAKAKKISFLPEQLKIILANNMSDEAMKNLDKKKLIEFVSHQISVEKRVAIDKDSIQESLMILAQGRSTQSVSHKMNSTDKKNIKENIKDNIKTKRIEKNKTTYGQWMTPEMCLENSFALLPLPLVNEVCNAFLVDINEFLTIPNDVRHISDSVDIPKSDISDISEISKLNNSMLVERRVKFVKEAVSSALQEKQSSSSSSPSPSSSLLSPSSTSVPSLVKMFRPNTDYPCIMFDLSPLLTEIGIDMNKYPNPQKDEINNFMLTYFCGLLNYHSMKQYGVEHVIWAETQASFGGIRPSITDTGNSFRLSPGLVPDNYAAVVSHAYQDLCDSLSGDFITMLRDDISKNALVTMTKKDRYNLNASLYQANQHGLRGIMHMMALEFIADNKHDDKKMDICLSEYFKFSIQETQNTINLDSSRRDTFNKVSNLIQKDKQTPPQNSIATEEAKLLLLSLALQANKSCQFTCMQPESNESKIENQINDKLQILSSRILSASFSWDFSETCSYTEHLFRLLKIKEDFAKIADYASQNRDELSDDSELSIDAYPEKGGMAALNSIMAGILPDIDSGYIPIFDEKGGYVLEKDLRDDVYFEISDKILAIVAEISNINSLPQKNAASENNLSCKLIDLAQFPTYGTESSKSRWASESNWDEIDNPDLLIIDSTSSSAKEISDVLTKLRNHTKGPPYCVIVFSSENKVAQTVDLVAMGEIRIHLSPSLFAADTPTNKRDKILNSLDRIRQGLNSSNTNTLSARSMRKVLEKSHIRKSTLKDEVKEVVASLLNTSSDNKSEIIINKLLEYIKHKSEYGNYNEKSSRKLQETIITALEQANRFDLSKEIKKQMESSLPSKASLISNQVFFKSKENIPTISSLDSSKEEIKTPSNTRSKDHNK
jgi:hypothetical protein